MLRIQSSFQSLIYVLIRIVLAYTLYLIIAKHIETGQFFEPFYLLTELLLLFIILFSDGDQILVDEEVFIFKEGRLFSSKVTIPLQDINDFRLKGKIDHPWQALLALPPFKFLGYQSHLQFVLHNGKMIDIYTSMPGSKLKELYQLFESRY